LHSVLALYALLSALVCSLWWLTSKPWATFKKFWLRVLARVYSNLLPCSLLQYTISFSLHFVLWLKMESIFSFWTTLKYTGAPYMANMVLSNPCRINSILPSRKGKWMIINRCITTFHSSKHFEVNYNEIFGLSKNIMMIKAIMHVHVIKLQKYTCLKRNIKYM